MPKSAFNAIEGSVRIFLSGAKVALIACDENELPLKPAERC